MRYPVGEPTTPAAVSSKRLLAGVSLVDAMSFLTYAAHMSPDHKPLVWLHGEVRTPPFSQAARLESGSLLRRLQQGDTLSMPHSRPMPSIGARCHELRVNDQNATWRLVYRVDDDAIVILEVFSKKTAKTPSRVIAACQRRMKAYDDA